MTDPATCGLDECALASVTTLPMLAARLSTSNRDVTVDQLKALARKATGRLDDPDGRLRDVRSRVHELLSQVTLPPYARSVRKQDPGVAELRQHPASDGPARFDPSVPIMKLVDFFEQRMLCSKDVAVLLAQLLTAHDHLPTGSRSSPILSYFVNQKMFDEVALFAEAKGLEMMLHVDESRLSIQVCSPRQAAGQ